MKRIVFSLMLLYLSIGTISAQQKIEEMAKEIWRNFPTECDMMASGGYRFNTILPVNLVRESLLDSLKAAFNAEIPNATYVAVVKHHIYMAHPSNMSDTLSYTLGWGGINEGYLQQSHKEEPNERGRSVFPFSPFFATLDIVNDMLFFQYAHEFNSGVGIDWRRYNPSGFDALLNQIKSLPKVRKKKVKFPETAFGYEYIVSQDADSLYRRIGQFLIQDYFNGNKPEYFRYPLQHKYTSFYEDQCYLDFGNGRKVEICVRHDNLLILDVDGSGTDDWQKMLEPELDSLHFAQMKLSTIQVGDRYYSLKLFAHDIIDEFCPDLLKPLLSYEVSDLKTYNGDSRPHNGRQYYTVTVRYQHQKERGIPYDYAAIVEIWNNQENSRWARYDPATAKSVTFGDGTHIDFIEKSLLERIKAKRQ